MTLEEDLTRLEADLPRQRLDRRALDDELILLIRLYGGRLCDSDQALLRLLIVPANTYRDIALLTGQSPSTVCRRFHRIIRTLHLLAEAVRATGRVRRDYFEHRLSQRHIAARYNLSRHQVRKILAAPSGRIGA